MSKPLIIFDLDGTLADTAPDLLATLNRIIGPHGIDPVLRLNLGHLVGQGARVMIQRAFEDNGRDLADDLLDNLFDQFLEDYSANIAVHTKLFEGVEAAMDNLQAMGYGFAVCTNKTEALARQLLSELKIQHRFDAITGRDTFPFCKPDGRHILETVSLASADKNQSIMIGDSVTDTTAAKNAGISSVVVSFGYSSQPVTELAADRIIDHFEELPDIVAEIANSYPALSGRRD